MELTPWTILFTVVIVAALGVLFFPFLFRVVFNINFAGIDARFFFFKKKLYHFEKKFRESGASNDDDAKDDSKDDGEVVVPEYVPPPKNDEIRISKREPTEMSNAPNKNREDVNNDENASENHYENSKVNHEASSKESSWTKGKEESKEPLKADVDSNAVDAEEDEISKKEKKKLTDVEFWTILLTPEFDTTALWALKKWLFLLLRMLHIQFKDCFVEGFRGEYQNMGYGAAGSSYLKGLPYIGAWDFRMDWTYTHEPRAAGQISANVNLYRFLIFILATLFYGSLIALKFFCRRSKVLKTHELPELGWIRNKIVKLMAEE